ncbi:unnamed protein product [Ostreobium quekettii]|uniref:RNA-binding S4 domain-containing protein n=1 Tax=Ostreobium quekettii TaxID=121088 RepID=A0A8S1IL14_9CHLO|nr:unnamed protein product [Ostreobium quekettii]
MEPLLTRWRLGSVGPCGGARWRGLRVRACSRGAQRARRRDTERAGGRASPAEGPQRLSKVLAAAGVAARRKAEEIIFSSQVTVNGVVVTTPQTRVDASKDVIEVDGRRVDTANQEKYYFAVNKPKGFLCSAKPSYKEGENKKLVLDLFENWISGWKRSNPQGKVPPRLFTVGRLDANSYGLLLVTNDGTSQGGSLMLEETASKVEMLKWCIT